MSLVRFNKSSETFSLIPRNLEEAMKYAELIANSDFCPKESRGKAGNILVAIQYGAELGLSPMQALQNISVINGKPSLWGDALLGLVKAHHTFVDIQEEIKNDVAYCRVERKNSKPVEVTFSIEDAKKANLWGKAGPWTQYPKRMLQMRARSFALRDAFADVLKGLNMREEVEDYEVKPKYKTKISKIIEDKKAEVKIIPASENNIMQGNLDEDLLNISQCNNMEELEAAYKKSYIYWGKLRDQESLQKVIMAKDEKKKLLEDVKSFNEEINAEEKKNE